MSDKRKTQKSSYGGFGLTHLKIDEVMSEETPVLCSSYHSAIPA